MAADRRVLLAVYAGGCAGALARVLVGEALPHDPGTWPWATFAVNTAGAFLLGYLATALPRRAAAASALLGPGFCGAFTTFSALQLELLELLDADRAGLAVFYAGATVGAGLCAVALARRAASGAPG